MSDVSLQSKHVGTLHLSFMRDACVCVCGGGGGGGGLRVEGGAWSATRSHPRPSSLSGQPYRPSLYSSASDQHFHTRRKQKNNIVYKPH